ncbi:hypothetical protein [Lysobacter gummosus]
MRTRTAAGARRRAYKRGIALSERHRRWRCREVFCGRAFRPDALRSDRRHLTLRVNEFAMPKNQSTDRFDSAGQLSGKHRG